MKFFILILSIPIFLFPITPTLETYDQSHIVLSFPCIQGSTTYNIYRLPFISKRRDAKPRLYDKLFITQQTEICYYEDWYPFDLTERQEEFLEYIITYNSPDGFSESSFLEGYNNRLRLQKAKANFEVTAENFCPETTITFNQTSTGLVSYYKWYLAEEILGEEAQFFHSFSEPGEYEIKLEAGGPIGRSFKEKLIKIFEPPAPKIEGQNYACEGTFLYTDEGMNDYKWYFNGQEIEGATENKLYITKEGIYSVSYLDENLCFGKSADFEFHHFEEPIALFTSIDEIQAGEFISFTNNSTGEGLQFTWDFGDGEISFEDNPVYVFRKTGIFAVKLTVKDKCGKESTYQKEINVRNGKFDISIDRGTSMGGTEILIKADNFPENPNVYIDGKIANIISANSNEIKILTPEHLGGLDFYDIEIKDQSNNLLYKMNKMFRFIDFGFVSVPDKGKIAVIDLNKNEEYKSNNYYLPIDTINPKAMEVYKNYLIIGGKGAIYKFNIGTFQLENIYFLEENDYVFALKISAGLYGNYLFSSIYNDTKNPKGKILIINFDNFEKLAEADFKGSEDGVGLEFEEALEKIYLLSNGPISSSNNQEHKKKMIINIYNPFSEFEEKDGKYYLPLELWLAKDKDSPNSYFNGAITKTKDESRLYFYDPVNQKIVEVQTTTNTFKGPDIETLNQTNSLLSFYKNEDILLNLTTNSLEIYNLPQEGKKNLYKTITFSNCINPRDLESFKDEISILCENNKIIFINKNDFNFSNEFNFSQEEILQKIKVMEYEGE